MKETLLFFVLELVIIPASLTIGYLFDALKGVAM